MHPNFGSKAECSGTGQSGLRRRSVRGGGGWAHGKRVGPMVPSICKRRDKHTYDARKITGKANGEAETKWCFTRVGHKMARPCVGGRAS